MFTAIASFVKYVNFRPFEPVIIFFIEKVSLSLPSVRYAVPPTYLKMCERGMDTVRETLFLRSIVTGVPGTNFMPAGALDQSQ